ncbi:MAG: VOC family protein [Chloroflexota bacterium]
MTQPTAKDVKAFVPAKNFSESLNFYQALGWKLNWQNGGLAELELAGNRFFLQDFYFKKLAENFMLYVNVNDAQGWWEHVSAVLESGEFPTARAQQPKHETYGATVTYVWDPSGVLLHFAEILD